MDEGHDQLTNWANGCPPDSPLRQIESSVLASNPTASGDEIYDLMNAAYQTDAAKKRSYIYDYQTALDICQHPEIMPLHGFTSAPGTDAGPLVPLFTFAKTNIHSDVLVTPLEQYSDTYIGYDPDWNKKEFNKLMWRGSTTGAKFEVGEDWRASQRARLHYLTNELKGNRNVLVAAEEGPIREEIMPMRNLNKAQMDVSFSGGPVQCDDETCEIMRKEIDFRPTMGLHDSYQVCFCQREPRCACLRADHSARLRCVSSIVQIRDGRGRQRLVRTFPPSHVDEGVRVEVDAVPRVVW